MRPIKSKVKFARELNHQFITTLTTLLTSAFGLVAAFAWNEVVKEVIDRYISPGQGLISKGIYALIITILTVIISFQLGKLQAIAKIEEEEDEKTSKEK